MFKRNLKDYLNKQLGVGPALFITIGIGFFLISLAAIAVWYFAVGKEVGSEEQRAKLEIHNDDFVRGDSGAPLVMFEYSDYQCPFCRRFFQGAYRQIEEQYIKTGQLKFIYRDFIFYGDESLRAASAARCAGEQGKFWEYHDLLLNKQKGVGTGLFSQENLKEFGVEVGVADSLRFNMCVGELRYAQRVGALSHEGRTLGVWGTPSFFINGRGPIFGNNYFSVFQGLIEAALAETKPGK